MANITRIGLIVLLVFFVGCASAPPRSYNSPPEVMSKMNRAIKDTLECIKPEDSVRFYVSSASGVRAWIRKDRIFVTESGIRKFSDNTLKFVLAHEIAHSKLKHIQKKVAASYVVTGVMTVVNVFIPGAGWLNYAINPAVVNNFSKFQEYDADKEAAKVGECLGMSPAHVIEAMEETRSFTGKGGSFWSQHPAWNDRIENIRNQ